MSSCPSPRAHSAASACGRVPPTVRRAGRPGERAGPRWPGRAVWWRAEPLAQRLLRRRCRHVQLSRSCPHSANPLNPASGRQHSALTHPGWAPASRHPRCSLQGRPGSYCPAIAVTLLNRMPPPRLPQTHAGGARLTCSWSSGHQRVPTDAEHHRHHHQHSQHCAHHRFLNSSVSLY